MVLVLFFCSGATALIYEVIWSKFLSLMFGSTVQAQTVVLAVFMGGLALGNRLIGSRSDLLRQPLAAYGYIEAIIGLYAFFFNWIYGSADSFFVKTGSSLLSNSFGLLLLKGGLSVSLLLLPTILMGGTLPLLAAWLQKSSADAGRRSAIFYSINSLGAVFGSFLAGFVLVQALGLPVTLQMTGFANVTIGIIAIGLARRLRGEEAATEQPTSTSATNLTTDPLLRRACLLVAMTGAVSMGLEVLSSRCLAMVFGASLEAFAMVLISFILGIGIGSAIIGSRRFNQYLSEKMVFFSLVIAASWIGVLIFGIEEFVYVYRHLKSGLAATSMGYRLNQFLTMSVSLIVLGVPAALLGAVLPMCMRLVSAGAETLGARVGRLLTWNTLGAVAGVMITGFILMPNAGLRGSFGILAAVLCTGGVLVALFQKADRLAFVGITALVLIGADGFLGGQSWRIVLSSGIFRHREQEVLEEAMDIRRKSIQLLYYKDAPDATVSVEQSLVDDGKLSLRINGKVDASSSGDFSTQCLLAHLPMAIRPESKDVFLVGLGSGITGGAVLGHPIDRLTVAENCKPVITAAELFSRFNSGVVTNTRTRIVSEDARTVLKLSPDRYDVIINQPSNPWMAGIGSVFSREFYQLCSQRLKPGGVVSQWFHVYEMSDEIVFLVVRSFNSVFPYMELWDTGAGDLILLGSNDPFEYSVRVADKLFTREIPREHLQRIGLADARMLWTRQIASQKTASAIPGIGPVQTDAFPILEYAAPRAFFIGQTAKRIFNFDERTWQSAIASQEKVESLSSLTEDQLRGIFAVGTVNEDVKNYLELRTQSHDANSFVMQKNNGMPSIFRSTSSAPAPFFQKDSGNEKIDLFAQVETFIYSTNVTRGLQWIETVANKESLGEKDEERLERLIGIAAKECIRRGDNVTAVKLLQTGLRRKPNSEELNYLARLLSGQIKKA